LVNTRAVVCRRHKLSINRLYTQQLWDRFTMTLEWPKLADSFKLTDRLDQSGPRQERE